MARPRDRRSILRHTAACLLLAASVAAVDAQPLPATPIPRVTGPIPATAESFPFLAAHRLQEPMDLAARGYVEEEFLVSGTANVYDWAADGSLTPVRTGAGYTTRMLVRRPASASRFSGTVIVEPIHAPRGLDFPLMWGWIHEHVVEQGHAWVGVTMSPDAAQALKAFNPSRYASLSWANPNPAETCQPGGRGNQAPVASPVEEGLVWDILSQAGALLKAGGAGPMGGLRVDRLYMTTQDAVQVTYISAVQPRARLASGAPVYDGHLLKSGRRAKRIRRCAPTPGDGDPRHVMRNAGVPIINVLQEGDVLAGVRERRADSDEPADRFRLWEVAGTAHSGVSPYRWSTATIADHVAAGGEVVARTFSEAIGAYTMAVPFKDPARCQPTEMVTEQPLVSYSFHAGFAALEAWVRAGTPAPKAARIGIVDAGTPQARIETDTHGNAVGGMRSPYLDVPAATFHSGHGAGPGCGQNFGYSEPFSWQRMERLYGTYAAYARKVATSIDAAVAARWLTQADARKVRSELIPEAP